MNVRSFALALSALLLVAGPAAAMRFGGGPHGGLRAVPSFGGRLVPGGHFVRPGFLPPGSVVRPGFLPRRGIALVPGAFVFGGFPQAPVIVILPEGGVQRPAARSPRPAPRPRPAPTGAAPAAPPTSLAAMSPYPRGYYACNAPGEPRRFCPLYP